MERSLLKSTRMSLFTHASYGQRETTGALRSTPNKFRYSSLFTSSIAEAIDLDPNGIMAAKKRNADRAMEEAICHHTPEIPPTNRSLS